MIDLSTSQSLIAAGIVATLAASAIAILKGAPGKVGLLLKNRLSVAIEIRDENVIPAVSEWFAVQPYGERCRRLAVESSSPAGGEEGGLVRLVFSPSRGHHFIWHDGRGYWLERTSDKPLAGTSGLSLVDREVIRLRTWGTDTAPLRRIVAAAMQMAYDRQRGTMVVYCPNGWGGWERLKSSDAGRPLESIILREGMREEIVADIARFLSRRDWYAEMGIPYRRGIGLYGPPGCGKSQLIGAIAARFNLPMYLLTLSGKLGDDDLLRLIRKAAPGSIILIEDIDAAFVERTSTDESASRVTFSGLLNALDGVAAQQGKILFMTTNHPERLDPALRRRGRIDREYTLTYCDADMLQRMYLRFFPDEPMFADEFAALNAGRELAPCDVQEHLVARADDAYRAVAEPVETGKEVAV